MEFEQNKVQKTTAHLLSRTKKCVCERGYGFFLTQTQGRPSILGEMVCRYAWTQGIKRQSQLSFWSAKCEVESGKH